MATCDFTNSVQGFHQGLIYTESTGESRIVGFAKRDSFKDHNVARHRGVK